jgi:hypothetical protein
MYDPAQILRTLILIHRVHAPRLTFVIHVYEYEFMFIYKELLLAGLAIWIAATVSLRLEGQHILHPRDWSGTLILFAVSFPLMAVVVRRICKRMQLPRDQWLAGAFSIALPTLLLDPFSSAFFPVLFPNMSRDVAGVFGGWMLWCCAGAFVGVAIFRPAPADRQNFKGQPQ